MTGPRAGGASWTRGAATRRSRRRATADDRPAPAAASGDRPGDGPRRRRRAQARQPVPAVRPVRRHPPGFARPRPVRPRHARPVVRGPADQRRPPDAAAGPVGGEPHQHDPADEPRARRDPAIKQGAGEALAHARDLDHAPALDRRRPRRAHRGHELQLDARSRSSSSWSSTPTRPTSSRSAAGSGSGAARYRPTEATPGVARLRLRGPRRPGPADARVVHAGRGQRRAIRTRPAGEGSVRIRWTLDVEPGGRGERPLGGLDRPVADAGPRATRRGDAGPARAVGRRGDVDARRDPAAADGGAPATIAEPTRRRGGVRQLDTSAARASAPTASCSTSRSGGASPTCGSSGTTGRCAASTTSRPASRGSRRCSGGTASSPRSRSCRSCPTSRARRSASWPTGRRPRTTRTATWSRARSSTSCASASWPGPASCRTGRTTAAIDATPLWLILLDETYRWTGDLDLVRSLWPNALAALEWIDRYGDRDGDGFVEYERRTPAGLLNQGWKDSGDAIRHRDGTLAVGADRARRDPGLRLRREAPDGLASRGASATPTLAARLDREAARAATAASTTRSGCRTSGFYAIALDRDKRQVGHDRRRTRGTACGAASSRRSGSTPSSTACSTRRWTAAGASGPTPRASPATTRSATTRARSGRTTTRSSRRA